MAGKYDPTVKTLVETTPDAWLPLVDRPPARVTVEDADISTVISGAADKVLRVHGDPEYLLHLDFQAGHDTSRLPPRLRLYNTVLDYRHDLPVLSVAVLLHPGADSPQLSGSIERAIGGEKPHAFLRYKVLRIWEVPVEQLLTGGLGVLPLAPLSKVAEENLPEVIRRIDQRLQSVEKSRAADLWTATNILLGVRYSEEFAQLLLRGVLSMRESTTYQAILAEGKAEGKAEGELEEARRLLLLLGEKPFGPPDEATRAAVQAIADLRQLEQLGQRLFDVKSWAELLGQPQSPSPRKRRRKPS